jgi:prepilin signal peptidase PulO-like enzyme (type II secretory pathway)
VEVIGQNYDKELVSRVEQTQDNALKKLYAEYEKGIVRKKKILAFCHLLGHKIMPAIAIWFVISYWLAGMFQYYGVHFSINVTVELVFSGIYFLSFIVLQLASKDMAKAFQ